MKGRRHHHRQERRPSHGLHRRSKPLQEHQRAAPVSRLSGGRGNPSLGYALAAAAVLLIAALTFTCLQLLGSRHARPDALHDRTAPFESPSPQLSTATPMPSRGAGSAPASSEVLTQQFAGFLESRSSTDGIAVQPVGTESTPIVLGTWVEGPAWSTVKVPLAIAATRENPATTVSSEAAAAITESDNAAAEALWDSLGEPTTAAKKVEAVLAEVGSAPEVQSQRIRPGFSAFGQTVWSIADQARFAAHLACDPNDGQVLELMGQITASQRWGLGNLSDARFKGGWGPGPTGGYLVRQFGIINTPRGSVAIAMAAQPRSGSFDDGIQQLDAMVGWLNDRLDSLPAGRCAP